MKPHLFLKNPSGEKRKFNAARMVAEPEAAVSKPPQSYRPQKNKLAGLISEFNNQRLSRINQRTLRIPEHLEYIKIDFFIVFNDNPPFRTRSRFLKEFGLTPVVYSQFNQSVLFAIINEEKLTAFIKLLWDFINSSDTISPMKTGYSIATLLYDFQFLSTAEILENVPQKDAILSLVRKEETISPTFNKIYSSLIAHLQRLKKVKTVAEFATDGVSTIEIKNINAVNIKIIAENFDIIYRIQSLRTPTIKVNHFNIPELTWNFTIRPPHKSGVIIGVIDNGVKAIAPLQEILVDLKLDITNTITPNALKAEHPHGTIVSTLAALGLDYFNTQKIDFQADAYILPIKILNFAKGYFNIYDIKAALQTAISNGVRIFNLSVCGPGKMYNATVSEYAYMLDKLAYENDILIFIATGNLGYDDIEAMIENPPAGKDANFHNYPNHFYNPFKQSDYHVCEASNICMPGESYNNMTVGAIADNLINDSATGLTPFKELPAVYTRKSHMDYSKKVNGSYFTLKQMNTNINKPDIVMPGGDLLNPQSAMQVVGLGISGSDFFIREAGTSFSAPLSANLAAKIIAAYPGLNMQSVKALILNNAKQLLASEFLDELMEEIKQEAANNRFNKDYSTLDTEERKLINEHYKSDLLYQKLVGYGMPQIDKTLYSDSKSVSIIVQDSIAVESHKVINLNIPDYLLKYDKPSYILSLKATLCYKFLPVWNNQLGYNPLHISFNFLNSVKHDDPVETAAIVADKDHQFFQNITRGIADPVKKAQARSKALAIKTNLSSWSEDFYPPATKPFSNTQQLTLNIKKDEIRKVNNQVSIVIRCTYKRDMDKAIIEQLMQSAHEFSIVLNVSEKDNKLLKDFDLYDELVACNDLDIITVAELDSDLEV